jgi:Icc-related predicted phosphoesterase
MRILTVSDIIVPTLYGLFEAERFGHVDLVISCGDLPPEYLEFLVDAFRAPLYYVCGNHDLRYRDKPPGGGVNIHRRMVAFGGLRILGLEGSRWYNGGPYQYTERQMRGMIRKLRPTLWWRGGVDLVVTHAPPRHIHDAEDRCHKGFNSLRWLIKRYQPAYLIHGHIHSQFDHPAERISQVNATQVINSCGYYILETGDNDLAQ